MSRKAVCEEYEHEQASWLYACSKSKDNDNNKFWQILSRLLTWTTSGTGKRKPSGDLPWIVVNLAAKKTRHTTKTLNKQVCFHSLEVKRWRRPAAPWGSVQCCLPLQQPVRACTPWGGSTCDVSWPWPGFYTGLSCLFIWWVGLWVGSTCTLPGLAVWVQPRRSGWFSLNLEARWSDCTCMPSITPMRKRTSMKMSRAAQPGIAWVMGQNLIPGLSHILLTDFQPCPIAHVHRSSCWSCLPEACLLLQNRVNRDHCGEDEERKAADIADVVEDCGVL